jgi:hypothetical protein
MFANTADFKTISKNPDVDPMQVIEFINTAIYLYDKVVSTYDSVHKIETKADGSYMVVAGIEEEFEVNLDKIAGDQISRRSFVSLTSKTKLINIVKTDIQV